MGEAIMKRFHPKRHLLNMSDFDSWMSYEPRRHTSLRVLIVFPMKTNKKHRNTSTFKSKRKIQNRWEKRNFHKVAKKETDGKTFTIYFGGGV